MRSIRSVATIVVLLMVVPTLIPGEVPEGYGVEVVEKEQDPYGLTDDDRSPQELLSGSYMYEKSGWRVVHAEGDPYQVGFQIGWYLSENISWGIASMMKYREKAGKDWDHYREAGLTFWRFIDEEYRLEIQGIGAGLEAKGETYHQDSRVLDWIDALAINAVFDTMHRDGDIAKKQGMLPFPENAETLEEMGVDAGPDGIYGTADDGDPGYMEACSAFAAAGDALEDGGVMLAQSTWFGYAIASPYWHILDIEPTNGHRVIFQSYAGMIWSGADFYQNGAGLAIGETTIGAAPYGYDREPVFLRIRRAVQYSSTIDQFIGLMTASSNGAYTNDWLIADSNTGEIAVLELGTDAWDIIRTRNGFIISTNFPWGPKVRAEMGLDPDSDPSKTVSRWRRFEELRDANYGHITMEDGKDFMSDHVNAFSREDFSNGSVSICGHYEKRGQPAGPYPHGILDTKITNTTLIQNMQFIAIRGHPCGEDFIAEDLVKANPSFGTLQPFMATFEAQEWVSISRLVEVDLVVMTPEGNACDDCTVRLESVDDDTSVIGNTDQDGLVTLEGFTSGPYTMSVESADGMAISQGSLMLDDDRQSFSVELTQQVTIQEGIPPSTVFIVFLVMFIIGALILMRDRLGSIRTRFMKKGVQEPVVSD